MSESRDRWGLYFCLVGFGLLVAAWFLTPLGMFVGISLTMSKIRRMEARMQDTEIFLPVATNLALYCQSFETLRLTNGVGASRLPHPLPSLGSPHALFETNHAYIEFGGGFYHYGYGLRLDEEASSPQINVWELYLSREGQGEKLLHRFTLPSAARVTVSEFTSNSIAEYNRRLAKSPGDLELHKAKISLLIQYSRNEVRAACLSAIKAMPHHWWPRLTLALIDTGKGKHLEAAIELTKFVESRPSYSRYIYLAYFYQLTDRPKESAQAIEKAIFFPIVDLDDDHTNTECRGYSAGVYAFRNREFPTVIKLCNALLPVKDNGGYAKGALRDLQSAAEAAMTGSNAQFTPSESVLAFDPYETVDIRALLSR